jgi:poly-beta-1,6-N-acetyl-D-glucosamine synthase
MRMLFWSSVTLIFLAYVGYPIYLYMRARLWPRPVLRKSILPSVSVILAVHNEEKYLAAKLQNIAGLDYPSDQLQVIVVSDGSTDATNDILKDWQGPSRIAVFAPRAGKAVAINLGREAASGEILVFTDARQVVAEDALRQLTANFADPSVGCVSGELMIGQNQDGSGAAGVGMYWRLEKKIRQWEGLTGSMVGATGALYAARRELLVTLPQGTILDDVYVPLQVAREGKRVVFEPQARAFDPVTPNPKQEFARKLRTLYGNYQLLQLAPWILTSSNPLRTRFICHKCLRLVVPFALIGTIVSSFYLGLRTFYDVALVAQLTFYALALFKGYSTKLRILSRMADVSLAFLMLNSAAALAFVYFVGRKKAVWAR